VRAELSEVAQDLFLAHGYESTTVDQIATAAGLSKRSFFRYFASKEDLVLDKYELLGDDLVAAIAARPKGEAAWDSLRHAFDVVLDYYSDAHRRDRATMMQALVSSTPTLQARYLQKWEGVQERIAAVVQERAPKRAAASDPVVARAFVDAASACLSGAVRQAIQSGNIDTLPAELDSIMAALRPHTA
jgi:AcrR family transcriptional regulator